MNSYKTMKYFIFMLFAAGSCNGQSENLKFDGELSGLAEDTKVILSDMMGEQFHDTATVTNNSFTFDCKLPGAGTYVLRVGLVGQKPENRVFYLDKGKVSLKGKRGNLKKAKLSGEEAYIKDWLELDSLVNNDALFALHSRQNDTVIMLAAKTGSYDGLFADTAFVSRSAAVFPKVAARKIELGKTWLSEHPKSDINAYVVHKYLRGELDEEEMKQTLDALSPAARNSLIGKKLLSSLDR